MMMIIILISILVVIIIMIIPLRARIASTLAFCSGRMSLKMIIIMIII